MNNVSFAGIGRDYLAHVPSSGSQTGTFKTLLGRLVADLCSMAAAVKAGYVDAPATLFLYDAYTMTAGAVQQIDTFIKIQHTIYIYLYSQFFEVANVD